ncbi:Protein-serine/threonine kinase, partial [Pseudozyma hubeiensis]
WCSSDINQPQYNPQAGSFLAEELPIRLCIVSRLDELPHDLMMPLSESVQKLLQTSSKALEPLPESKPNPSLLNRLPSPTTALRAHKAQCPTRQTARTAALSHALLEHRYYANLPDHQWPSEIEQYNEDSTKALEKIKG